MLLERGGAVKTKRQMWLAAEGLMRQPI